MSEDFRSRKSPSELEAMFRQLEAGFEARMDWVKQMAMAGFDLALAEKLRCRRVVLVRNHESPAWRVLKQLNPDLFP